MALEFVDVSTVSSPFVVRVIVLGLPRTVEIDVPAEDEHETMAEFEDCLWEALLQSVGAHHDLRSAGQLKLFYRGRCINDCETNTLSAWEVGRTAVVSALICFPYSAIAAPTAYAVATDEQDGPATVDLSQDSDGETDGVHSTANHAATNATIDCLTDDDDGGGGGGDGGGSGSHDSGDDDDVVMTFSATAARTDPVCIANNPLSILKYHQTFQQINAAIHAKNVRQVETLLNSANTPTAVGPTDGDDDLRHNIVECPEHFCDVVQHSPPMTNSEVVAWSGASAGAVGRGGGDSGNDRHDDEGGGGGGGDEYDDDDDDDDDVGFEITPQAVARLTALGFSADVACDALKHTSGNVAAAANRLFDSQYQ